MSIFVAPLLSFLINGLGQIYNRQIKKGIVFIIISLIFMVGFVAGMVLIFKIIVLSFNNTLNFREIMQGVVLLTVSGFILSVNGLWSIIDAYKIAKKNANQSKGNPQS
jgi:TM2 domain-containing membrane protein YozV